MADVSPRPTVAGHGVRELGQPLEEIDGKFPPIWQILSANGVSTGIFGSLHTYPPPADYENYSFYVPDFFANGPEIHPSELSSFQEFNLAMSRSSGRNVSPKVSWRSALRMRHNA